MRIGLRAKLLGVTVILLGAVTLGALREVYFYIGQQVREQSARRLHVGGHVLTSILDRTKEQLRGRGTLLVELPSLRAGLTVNHNELEPLLQQIKAIRAANLLWATDAQGRVLASTGEYPALDSALTNDPLVTKALHGRNALGFDEFLGEWWLVLCLPVHAADSAQQIGTVTLALLIGEAYLDRLTQLTGTDVGFLWRERPFWSKNWPDTSRQNIALQSVAVDPGVEQELAVGDSGRYVWVMRPLRIGLDPDDELVRVVLGTTLDESVIRQTAKAIGRIGVLVMLIGGVVLAAAIRSITRPLKSLVVDARRVGSGDLTHRARIRGADEVTELAVAFNQMVGNLSQSQEALLREKQFIDRVIRRMMNSVVVADFDGRITLINPSTLELLGYRESELLGCPLTELFHQTQSPFASVSWDAFLRQGVLRNAEAAYRSKSGKTIPVLFSGVVLRDSEAAQAIVCVAQDITDRKYLEQLKDNFITTVSHELRTPLAIINEGLSLLLEGEFGALNPEQQDFLQMTGRQMTRLQRLIGMLLDLTAIESGKLTLYQQPLDLAQLIDHAWRAQQSRAAQRTLIRQMAPVPPIQGDPQRIAQVLDHLLSNAVQFTREDGTVTVSVAQRDGMVAVCISDDGVGMATEECGKLFQKFVQLGRAEDERSGGTGLGLYLSRKLIEAHRGTIQVESDLGRGAAFTFFLPCSS